MNDECTLKVGRRGAQLRRAKFSSGGAFGWCRVGPTGIRVPDRALALSTCNSESRERSYTHMNTSIFSPTIAAFCQASCDSVRSQAGIETLGHYLQGVLEAGLHNTSSKEAREVKGLGRQLLLDNPTLIYFPEVLGDLAKLVHTEYDLAQAFDSQIRNRPWCCRTSSMRQVIPQFISLAHELHKEGCLSFGSYLTHVVELVEKVPRGLGLLRPSAQETVYRSIHSLADSLTAEETGRLYKAYKKLVRRPFPLRRPVFTQQELEFVKPPPIPILTVTISGGEDFEGDQEMTAFLDAPEETLAEHPIEAEFVGHEDDESLDDAETFETFREFIDFNGVTPMGLYDHPVHGTVLLLASIMGEVTVDGVEQTVYRGGAIYDRSEGKEVTLKNLSDGVVLGPYWYTDKNGTGHVIKGYKPQEGLRGVIGKYWTNVKRSCPKCLDLRPYNYYDPEEWPLVGGVCLKCQGRRTPDQQNGDIEEWKRWFIIRLKDDHYELDMISENKYSRLRGTIRRRLQAQKEMERAQAENSLLPPPTQLPSLRRRKDEGPNAPSP